jgi:hypothetical protein
MATNVASRESFCFARLYLFREVQSWDSCTDIDRCDAMRLIIKIERQGSGTPLLEEALCVLSEGGSSPLCFRY